MCVCVCVCVCTCVCMCTCMCTCVCVCVYVYGVCVPPCVYLCMCVSTYRVRLHVRVHTDHIIYSCANKVLDIKGHSHSPSYFPTAICTHINSVQISQRKRGSYLVWVDHTCGVCLISF